MVSAEAIATEAGCTNGLIYYHFGSMDHLFAATARVLGERGIRRIKDGLGGDRSTELWVDNLDEVIRAEAASSDGQAVLELMVAGHTSPVISAEMNAVMDEAPDNCAPRARAVRRRLTIGVGTSGRAGHRTCRGNVLGAGTVGSPGAPSTSTCWPPPCHGCCRYSDPDRSETAPSQRANRDIQAEHLYLSCR